MCVQSSCKVHIKSVTQQGAVSRFFTQKALVLSVVSEPALRQCSLWRGLLWLSPANYHSDDVSYSFICHPRHGQWAVRARGSNTYLRPTARQAHKRHISHCPHCCYCTHTKPRKSWLFAWTWRWWQYVLPKRRNRSNTKYDVKHTKKYDNQPLKPENKS